MLQTAATAVLFARASGWNNGQALTPPMGFANWNEFGCNYNDTTFREVAQAIVSSGLAARGYSYMLVQECIVPAGHRDPTTGVLQPDPVKFPYGLANLTAYFHGLGLKAGIYTDVAHLTCAGYEGSGPGPSTPSHWPLDALTFAQWGFDLIEADFCNTGGTNMTAFELYKAARDAIAAATAASGRGILFYQCNWGEQDPWLWAPQVSNAFRATGDVCAPGSAYFDRILSNFDGTVAITNTPPSQPGVPGTGIGAWADMDMITTGMQCCINDIEGRSHFSLASILSSPLFIGSDVRNMSAATLETLSNAEAIAINQDPLGVQASTVVGPSPFQGGMVLNLTACGANLQTLAWKAGGVPSTAVTASTNWTLQADGQVSDEQGNCLTVLECDNSPGSVVFSYQCVTNQCANQVWAWQPATGNLVSRVDGNQTVLCLTAVDPSTAPYSQLVIDTCSPGNTAQQWNWVGTGQLSTSAFTGRVFRGVAVAGAEDAGSDLCVAEAGNIGIYARPLAPKTGGSGQDIGVAVLNRGAQPSVGATIDLSAFALSPAQAVNVRDVWAGTTTGPFNGSFITRGMNAHETILLRLSLA